MLKIYWLDKYTVKEIRKTISFSKAKEINKQIKNTKQTKKIQNNAPWKKLHQERE